MTELRDTPGGRAYLMGEILVMLHDQEGFPFEIGLLTARDCGYDVALLGVLVECAKRNLSWKMVRDFISLYARIYSLTAAERRAAEFFGAD